MPSRIGEILVAQGACTAQDVREALQNQVIFGGRLGTNLLELRAVTEEALAHALATRHGSPSLFGEVAVDPAAVALLRPEVADRYEVVPYVFAERRLAILACDPGDLTMLDEVAFATGKQVHAIVAPEARVWALLRRTYGIERQLRGIEVDFASVRRPELAAPDAAAPSAAGSELMDEAGFDAIYGKTGSFALGSASPSVAPGPPDDVPELSAEESAALLEPVDDPPASLRVDVLASLPPGSGHAPPARFVPPVAAREEPEPPPLTFGEAVRLLQGVDARDAIARTVLRYARSKFRRAVLLTVHGGVARGWAGLGEALRPESVRRLRLPLGAPGIVETVVSTRAHFLGPIPKTEANVRLLKHLGGGVPGNAFLVPILALGRVVNVFYADNGRGGLVDASDLGELLILATRIAQSYDALLRRSGAQDGGR